MADNTMPQNGQICWYELATRDLGKAKEFYSELLGWELEQSKVVDLEYPEIKVDGTSVGGMLGMTDEWKDPTSGEMLPSHWMVYVAVDDVDKVAEEAALAGGKVCVPPTDIPVGRFSVINDPAGAFFSIIKLNS